MILSRRPPTKKELRVAAANLPVKFKNQDGNRYIIQIESFQ